MGNRPVLICSPNSRTFATADCWLLYLLQENQTGHFDNRKVNIAENVIQTRRDLVGSAVIPTMIVSWWTLKRHNLTLICSCPGNGCIFLILSLCHFNLILFIALNIVDQWSTRSKITKFYDDLWSRSPNLVIFYSPILQPFSRKSALELLLQSSRHQPLSPFEHKVARWQNYAA